MRGLQAKRYIHICISIHKIFTELKFQFCSPQIKLHVKRTQRKLIKKKQKRDKDKGILQHLLIPKNYFPIINKDESKLYLGFQFLGMTCAASVLEYLLWFSNSRIAFVNHVAFCTELVVMDSSGR